jgi:hypothetical protein
MKWKNLLLGQRTPPRRTTTAPEPRTRWETIAAQQRGTGRSLSDLWSTWRGKPRSPVRVCSHGHPVAEGSTVCSHGHYVG